jgi:hypothetical protein
MSGWTRLQFAVDPSRDRTDIDQVFDACQMCEWAEIDDGLFEAMLYQRFRTSEAMELVEMIAPDEAIVVAVDDTEDMVEAWTYEKNDEDAMRQMSRARAGQYERLGFSLRWGRCSLDGRRAFHGDVDRPVYSGERIDQSSGLQLVGSMLSEEES